MTCAKREVVCLLRPPPWSRDVGAVKQIFGTNGCDNPQVVCPRKPGEGYRPCKEVCAQRGHAEMEALRLAAELGVNLAGWHAVVYGHDYCCEECAKSLVGAGITRIGVTPVPFENY